MFSHSHPPQESHESQCEHVAEFHWRDNRGMEGDPWLPSSGFEGGGSRSVGVRRINSICNLKVPLPHHDLPTSLLLRVPLCKPSQRVNCRSCPVHKIFLKLSPLFTTPVHVPTANFSLRLLQLPLWCRSLSLSSQLSPAPPP